MAENEKDIQTEETMTPETEENATVETVEAADTEDMDAEAKMAEEEASEKPVKDKKDEKIEELNDRLVRQMAEFDNFRKRTEKEKQQMYGIGAADVVEKLLPVIDNFERGMAAMTEEEKSTAFAKGIEMVYKQLMTALEGMGVTPIEAFGKPFDPDFHNAVMQQPSDEFESGTIIQELQKGYMYKERVVRHSMVMVAE